MPQNEADQTQQEETKTEGTQEASTQDDPKAMIEDLQAQLDAVKSKNQELLSETKKAKNARKQEQERLQQIEEEKARKQGDYEQLLNSSETKRKELEERLNYMETNIKKEKVSNKALELANKVADGSNAKILSRFLADKLDYDDGEFAVLDDKGQKTVSKPEELLKSFTANEDFKSLLRGQKSTGSGASGTQQGNTNTTNKTVDRATFDSMPSQKKQEFLTKGGAVVDTKE